MKEYTEGGLKFQFDDKKWLLPDYQEKGEYVMFDKHPLYKAIEKIGNCKEKDKKGNLVSIRGAKAVDFVGILNDNIYLIEIKNNRQTEDIEQKKIECVTTDIANKVKDSLISIIGGKYNCKIDNKLWQNIVNLFYEKDNRIQIICWIEINTQDIDNKRINILHSLYARKLKTKLKWLIDSNKLLIVNKNIFYKEGFNKTLSFEVI